MKVKIECKECGGSGVYVGFAEKDGAAVVCQRCKGKGWREIFYNNFTGRKRREGVDRVFAVNCGISIGKIAGYESLEYFGGMSYDEWLFSGKFPKGSEMRNFVCPAWYYQLADLNKEPKWSACIACGSFKDCVHFFEKQHCWERFDKENVK